MGAIFFSPRGARHHYVFLRQLPPLPFTTNLEKHTRSLKQHPLPISERVLQKYLDFSPWARNGNQTPQRAPRNPRHQNEPSQQLQMTPPRMRTQVPPLLLVRRRTRDNKNSSKTEKLLNCFVRDKRTTSKIWNKKSIPLVMRISSLPAKSNFSSRRTDCYEIN